MIMHSGIICPNDRLEAGGGHDHLGQHGLQHEALVLA